MARTGNFLVVMLKQMWRCIKGIKNVFFSSLVLQEWMEFQQPGQVGDVTAHSRGVGNR